MSEPSNLRELANLREEVDLLRSRAELKSANLPQSELDALRKEILLLRCRVDDNSGELKVLNRFIRLQEPIRKEAPSE